MPRLTSKAYLVRRQFLRELWIERGCSQVAYFPMRMQNDLHDFFAPTESFADDEALCHRAEITKHFPSLPQQAGRAYEALLAHYEGRSSKVIDDYLACRPAPDMQPVSERGKSYRVKALPLVRPKIDHRRLAQGLLEPSRSPEGRRLYENVQAEKARKNASDEW